MYDWNSSALHLCIHEDFKHLASPLRLPSPLPKSTEPTANFLRDGSSFGPSLRRYVVCQTYQRGARSACPGRLQGTVGESIPCTACRERVTHASWERAYLWAQLVGKTGCRNGVRGARRAGCPHTFLRTWWHWPVMRMTFCVQISGWRQRFSPGPAD